MTIGQKIYELRTAHNLSQGDLAEKLDVSRQSVSKWETDAAIPDLDKLTKLCDLFGDTLDELVGRAGEGERQTATPSSASAQPNLPPAPNNALTTQKIVGYILLAVALLGGILLAIFVDPLIAVMIALPILICAIICLAGGRRAGYWCMWTVWFILEVLMNFFVSISVIETVAGSVPSSVAGSIVMIPLVIEVVLYVSLFILTLRVFKGESLSADKRKGILLAIAWIIYLALCVLPVMLMHMTIRMGNMFGVLVFYVLPSLIPMIATPFLFVRTARYLSGRKRKSQ